MKRYARNVTPNVARVSATLQGVLYGRLVASCLNQLKHDRSTGTKAFITSARRSISGPRLEKWGILAPASSSGTTASRIDEHLDSDRLPSETGGRHNSQASEYSGVLLSCIEEIDSEP